MSAESNGRSRAISEKIDTLPWEKLYAALEEAVSSLRLPQESLDSYQQSIESSIRAERKITQIYTRTSTLLADAKRALAQAKLLYKIQLRALLVDPDYAEHCRTKDERKLFVEASLIEEQKEVDIRNDRVERLVIYLDCVNKTLGQIKHFREDIGRRIKVLSIQREVGEF